MKISLHMKPSVFSAVFFLCILLGLKGPAYGYILIDSFTSIDSNAVATGYHGADAHYSGQPIGWRMLPTGWRIEPDFVSGYGGASTLVTVTESGLSDVLGGNRITSAQWNPYYGDASSVMSAGNGRASFNNGPDEMGWISFKYDGLTGSQRDFSAESAIRVNFDPDHLSYGRTSIMRLTLTDGDSSHSSDTIFPYSGGVNPDAMNVDFLLSPFALNGIDLAAINSIEVWYQGDNSNDVGFLHISTVPVPAAIWLLGSGLVGLLAMRRKHH